MCKIDELNICFRLRERNLQMKDTTSKEVLTSHDQLNKYLLADLQFNNIIDSRELFCEYVVKLYDENQITLDDARRVYYDHFRIDQIEQLHPVMLINCAMLGFEIDSIIQSDNTAAKLKLLSRGYVLEELSHDSDQNVKSRAKLLLYQKEQNELLPDHFKKICSQLNKEQVGCQLADESLLINFIDDMFDGYSADCYAKIDYNDFTNTYMYSIKYHDMSDDYFTHVEAKRLLELESRFCVQDNRLDIYTNDDVDVQRVINVLKFFYEEYM